MYIYMYVYYICIYTCIAHFIKYISVCAFSFKIAKSHVDCVCSCMYGCRCRGMDGLVSINVYQYIFIYMLLFTRIILSMYCRGNKCTSRSLANVSRSGLTDWHAGDWKCSSCGPQLHIVNLFSKSNKEKSRSIAGDEGGGRGVNVIDSEMLVLTENGFIFIGRCVVYMCCVCCVLVLCVCHMMLVSVCISFVCRRGCA